MPQKILLECDPGLDDALALQKKPTVARMVFVVGEQHA